MERLETKVNWRLLREGKVDLTTKDLHETEEALVDLFYSIETEVLLGEIDLPIKRLREISALVDSMADRRWNRWRRRLNDEIS